MTSSLTSCFLDADGRRWNSTGISSSRKPPRRRNSEYFGLRSTAAFSPFPAPATSLSARRHAIRNAAAHDRAGVPLGSGGAGSPKSKSAKSALVGGPVSLSSSHRRRGSSRTSSRSCSSSCSSSSPSSELFLGFGTGAAAAEVSALEACRSSSTMSLSMTLGYEEEIIFKLKRCPLRRPEFISFT